MEDVYDNKFEKLMTFMHDYISNKRKGVDCPYHFHNKEEWDKIFKDLKLKKEFEKDTISKYLFLRFNGVVYVLNV